ncbi:MAG: ATP-binding protein [Anaerolineales bacterium]|jgi:serine/threonine-protein kinase RsbW|nr:ATP-binding protein [Anaerolineales bacterium]
MQKIYQITRAAELGALSDFRQFIQSAASEHPGIDPETIYDLQLALDEAATNVITHGYAGMDPGSMILMLEIDSQRIRMTLNDFGHPFEPSNSPAPDLEAALEDRPIGGFGLYFIYQTMDEVDYVTTIDGNALILIKRRPDGN